MKGNLYKIIAAAFVVVLLLGEVALFLTTNNNIPQVEKGELKGVYDATITSWKPYVRVYGLSGSWCVEEAINGTNYTVVSFKDPLCAFLYNSSVYTTFVVENYTFSTYLKPLAPPGHHVVVSIDAITYGDRIVAIRSFSLKGNNDKAKVELKSLYNYSEYVYVVPFSERNILRELGFERYVKDVVLVDNPSKYQSLPGVLAVGDGYIIVAPNITNLTAASIDGEGVPSVVKSREPIESLSTYLEGEVYHYYLYSEQPFVPPTEYVGGALTFPVEGEVEGFRSGDVFLSVDHLKLLNGNATGG